LDATKLLLIDDNDDVRDVTALLLRDCGYDVIKASSGAAALTALEANPAISLMIVDFAMPGMSGIELLERARAKHPTIRAIFVTGYADHASLKGKFADEIVINKPFTMDQLAPAVRKALAQSKG
jgi:CheY-like chemotaxis protein